MKKFILALAAMLTVCVGASAKTVTIYSTDGTTREVAEGLLNMYYNSDWRTQPPVPMFTTDGRTTMAPFDEVEEYELQGWQLGTPVVMYSADGRSVTVPSGEVDTYKKLGWFAGQPVTMYSADGRTITVSADDIWDYKAIDWFTAPPVLMYSLDGRSMLVSSDETELYKGVGWLTEKPVQMFTADGRSMTVSVDQVDTYKNLGWYTAVPVTMYADDGRTCVVSGDEIQLYKNLGWYTAPPVTLYSADGRSMLFSGDEVEKYKALGWFRQPPVKMYSSNSRSIYVSGDEVDAYLANNWSYDPPKYHNKIAIFVYHSVRRDPFPTSPDICVKPEEFEKQLQLLAGGNSIGVFTSELDTLNFNMYTYFALTIDDGYDDNYTTIFPLLKKYGIKATLFMVGEKIGKPGYLTAEQLKEMSDSGLVSIQSHTMTHEPLAENIMEIEEATYELGVSKQLIESITGKTVDSLSYPNSSFDGALTKVAEDYYKFVFSDASYSAYNADDWYHIGRIYVGKDTGFELFRQYYETHCLV